MLERLRDILAWKDASSFHAGLIETHQASLRDEYRERVALFLRAGIGARVARLTEELPVRSLDRIFAAPETAHKLLCEPRTHFSHFINSLIAEHRLLGSAVDSGEPVWTALFDYQLWPPEHGVSRSRNVVALRLRNGIPIDLWSPQAEHAYFPPDGSSLPLSAEEAERARQRLEQAFDAIACISPTASDLIERYVKVVILRKGVNGNLLTSCSYDHFTGKMGLLNLHSTAVTLHEIMNGLVHEAIHSFLYMLEEGRPFFASEEVSYGQKLQSPWSGRELPLHSFLHACYVWYGLWLFWKKAVEAGFEPLTESRAMLNDARGGFFKPETHDRVAELVSHLTSHAQPVGALVEEARAGKYD
jgi:hypothetical protein